MSKKEKKPKKKVGKTILKVLLGILIAIIIIAIIVVIANFISVKSSNNFVSSIETVETDGLTPTIDSEDGYYTFTTDKDFKVVQLSDVHIGAGFLSAKKDIMAINAVEAMIREEKPDLVIITGDVAYPVPFQAGTFNNKNAEKIFARLMEKMGVYWCMAFGNHDTEAYSYYSREDISEVLSNKEEYPHCLYQEGPTDVDGCGNYIVKVENSSGDITQAFVMLDSHSYVDNDYLGILWKYDCVHQNQVDWYKSQIEELTKENNGVTPKSLMFFHMPLQEMQDAYYEYRDNGYEDTEDSKYLFGKAGEKDIVVYPSEYNYGLFQACLDLGSTQGIFFGHDHMNNFSMNYKGIQISYDYVVDYLAYAGISKFGTQRGCMVITTKPDGSFTSSLENYYQDKYQTINEKEQVSFDDYYSAEE